MNSPTTPSERELFAMAMTDAGYDEPEMGFGGGFLYQRDEDRFVGWSLARATTQREPLTDEQIKDAWDNTVAPDFEDGICFAEKHHGIGVTK